MTLTEITNIIYAALVETEDDVRCFAEQMTHAIEITIQVLDVLQGGLDVQMHTRSLKDGPIVQQIVEQIRAREA